ncbi:MAG: septum formation initiator family protein [Microbacterium sp.]|uniref:FtsB family cell division protein n=1 Tax=Microbacterium sp. TaxID=51671 RepID=UPI0039E43094
MARTAPPSRSRRARQSARAAERRVDVRGWLGGIRLSGFMVIMLGLVVLAAFVLVPTLGTYIDQRQQIAALEESVEVTADEVAALEQERSRWNDPAYITTQARERLYYVKPGEIVYLVDNDLDAADRPQEEASVSDTLQETKSDWMTQLVRSVASAGTATTARTKLTVGVPDPTPTRTG